MLGGTRRRSKLSGRRSNTASAPRSRSAAAPLPSRGGSGESRLRLRVEREGQRFSVPLTNPRHVIHKLGGPPCIVTAGKWRLHLNAAVSTVRLVRDEHGIHRVAFKTHDVAVKRNR